MSSGFSACTHFPSAPNCFCILALPGLPASGPLPGCHTTAPQCVTLCPAVMPYSRSHQPLAAGAGQPAVDGWQCGLAAFSITKRIFCIKYVILLLFFSCSVLPNCAFISFCRPYGDAGCHTTGAADHLKPTWCEALHRWGQLAINHWQRVVWQPAADSAVLSAFKITYRIFCIKYVIFMLFLVVISCIIVTFKTLLPLW